MRSTSTRLVLFFLGTASIMSMTGCNPEKLPESTHCDPESDTLALVEDTLSVQAMIEDSIPLITGSCEKGRPIGDRAQYHHRMIVGSSKTGSISVRSDAACFEISACHHNILGEIKSGTVVYTTNSLKNRGGSAGIAYAFLVRDAYGDTCRAYLSYLNFEGQEVF